MPIDNLDNGSPPSSFSKAAGSICTTAKTLFLVLFLLVAVPFLIILSFAVAASDSDEVRELKN
jgi:hypothetical protein